MNKILDKLQDEKSKLLYNARLDFYNNKINETEMINILVSTVDDTPKIEIKSFPKDTKEVIIWAFAYYGRILYWDLKKLGIKTLAFGDNNSKLNGYEYDGVKVETMPSIKEKYKDKCPIIITNFVRKEEIKKGLIEAGFNQDNIYSEYKIDSSSFYSKQYFDLPYLKFQKDEIFVDAGGFDGYTSLNFTKWCNKNYKKIFIFEPAPDFIPMCEETIRKNNLKNCEIIKAGAGEKEEILKFKMNNGGSMICEKGTIKIKTIPIDKITKDEKVTFIKMDIEGSELSALKGAKETILKNKPKLAISIYHKTEDIIEIPKYILELVPEYRFWLRHYTTCHGDTILYATI